ncbi:MAG: hypothetical protein PVF40_04750 [Ectothiorhodospiraceae bacterium]|jgi:hypothetical protein
MSEDNRHWLVRPENIRKLWGIFIVILIVTVLAELAVHLHPHFRIDGWFGFSAAYGFLTCVAMVVFAKLLGVFLKREDTYYDD